MTPAASLWAENRNLSFSRESSRREALIYLLGRVGRGERVPEELLVFLVAFTVSAGEAVS